MIYHCRFSPQVLYTAVADVKSYEEFLPYCKESTITARDPETDKPTKAILNVGWGQFEETFESVLKFDKEDTTVIAEAANSKMFKTLYTRWTILPLPNAKNNVKKCAVDFQLKFCFNSSLYNTVSKNFGPSISSIMIGAFTKRAKYLESLKEATSS